ncbi:MAG: type II toxin-antitoxin system YafQ family toxin [Kiritimatiellae bacterium]|nr:type II toxin-antitoxin system YafQ family toxin [Kiritimatiellia bacterium]
MLQPIYTKQFRKDVERCRKRGKSLEKFKRLALCLIEERPLDPVYKDHKLAGNYANQRDCHIEPDWLLIYKKDAEFVVFERMGSHSDLFK